MSEKEKKAIMDKVKGTKKCRFIFPERIGKDKRKLDGDILDRYAMYRPAPKDEIGATDYIDVIDRIEFEENTNRFEVIRFGYYRKTTDGKWIWGSQTTLSERMETLEKLFREASQSKPWFRDILCKALGIKATKEGISHE